MNALLKSRKNAPFNAYNSPVVHVQSNLAVTPAEMDSYRERGIPISSNQDPNKFYDGDSLSTVSIDPMLMRGVDINDAWNYEQSSKNRLNNANKNDIKLYGK